jgi:DNA-binding LacI/PurR family transcriptional regulator
MVGYKTMEDVAARAGVSRALVSLVMRGAPNVSDAKRQAVLEAAAELGYRPHAMARSLAQRRADMVGVLLSDLHNPFFAEIYDGLERAAGERGLRLLVSTGGRRRAGELAAVETFLGLRLDGVVLASTVLDARAIEAVASTVPVAMVSRTTRSRLVDTVVCDDGRGAELAVEHLVGLGHQRIAHIDGGSGAGARARRNGYVRAMRRLGLARHIRIEPGEFTEGAGAEAAKRLVTTGERPTAMFAANDLAAVGALSILENEGLRVPGDVSLVGFDNSALARLDAVPLTTINQPRYEMGRLTMQALIERIEGSTDLARHVLQPDLVVRASTGPPLS